MNKSADLYFLEGCGRCALGGTPQCKVHRYPDVLKLLRAIALESGLTEEAKWGVPCYTYQGKNIAMLSAFNDFAFLSFFKGSLLADDKKILSAAGENSQAGRFAKFTDAKEVSKQKKTLLAYLFEAIELERAGAKVVFKDVSEYEVPEELNEFFQKNTAFQKAFEALTPGRQKGYLLHFNGAKQSATKKSRIEKCIPKVMSGKGFHDY